MDEDEDEDVDLDVCPRCVPSNLCWPFGKCKLNQCG